MRTIVLLVIAMLLAGCSKDATEFACEPGELQTCPCIDGGQGVQECSDDRQGWEQCQCVVGEEDQDEEEEESMAGSNDVPGGYDGGSWTEGGIPINGGSDQESDGGNRMGGTPDNGGENDTHVGNVL